MGLVTEMYGPAAVEAAPPEAQRWAFFLEQGVKPICTFVRRRDGTSWAAPRLVVSYPGAQPPVPPDPLVPWDPQLEDWLLAHRVPARDAANEAARFGYDLRARLDVIERRHGTGAFTAVLLRCLYDHRCELYVALEKKLGAIRSYEPDAGATQTAVGIELEQVVRDSLETLGALAYRADEADEILKSAFGHYLRDRFEL